MESPVGLARCILGGVRDTSHDTDRDMAGSLEGEQKQRPITFPRAAAALAASSANSCRPKAVPAIPHPPSAASVRSTHVRPAWVASPESSTTTSVTSFTSCLWPSLDSAPGGVTTWTRTTRAEAVAAVWTALQVHLWMKAAVLFRWKGPGLATPSARGPPSLAHGRAYRRHPQGIGPMVRRRLSLA